MAEQLPAQRVNSWKETGKQVVNEVNYLAPNKSVKALEKELEKKLKES